MVSPGATIRCLMRAFERTCTWPCRPGWVLKLNGATLDPDATVEGCELVDASNLAAGIPMLGAGVEGGTSFVQEGIKDTLTESDYSWTPAELLKATAERMGPSSKALLRKGSYMLIPGT
jgi:hypothetical protein